MLVMKKSRYPRNRERRQFPYYRRTSNILAAIKSGVNTSTELAEKFNCSRPRMSVDLSRMADRLLIVKEKSVSLGKPGPPLIKWRVAEGI